MTTSFRTAAKVKGIALLVMAALFGVLLWLAFTESPLLGQGLAPLGWILISLAGIYLADAMTSVAVAVTSGRRSLPAAVMFALAALAGLLAAGGVSGLLPGMFGMWFSMVGWMALAGVFTALGGVFIRSLPLIVGGALTAAVGVVSYLIPDRFGIGFISVPVAMVALGACWLLTSRRGADDAPGQHPY